MVGQPMTPISQTISTDEALKLVADQRRRAVLEHLMNNGDQPVSVEELADRIADSDSPRTGSDGEYVAGIRVGLHHTHLPKLDAHGIIEFDPQRETVTYQSQHHVEELVRFVSQHME